MSSDKHLTARKFVQGLPPNKLNQATRREGGVWGDVGLKIHYVSPFSFTILFQKWNQAEIFSSQVL